MKIGIDIKSACEPRRSGIGNYTYNLIKQLLQVDDKNEYLLFSLPGKGEDLIIRGSKAKIINRRNPISLLTKTDVFHGPDFKLLPVRAARKLVTIHDLASYMDEDFMSQDFKKLTRRKIQDSIEKADVIVTVSNFVKEQLINYLSLNAGKIEVVYHGINENAPINLSGYEKEDVLRKAGIKPPFFLFVGNLELRKNIITLLKAFNFFKSKFKTNHQLVLIGKKGYGYEKISQELNSSPAKSDIREIGWTDDKELAVIYTFAELFIFPSFYEGFGMPLLEAMKFRVPVICSDTKVSREIASDAALFVNHVDFEGITESMYRVISNVELKNDIIEKGLNRIKYFSWEKAAKEMMDIYER